jgi:hypothetical protein
LRRWTALALADCARARSLLVVTARWSRREVEERPGTPSAREAESRKTSPAAQPRNLPQGSGTRTRTFGACTPGARNGTHEQARAVLDDLDLLLRLPRECEEASPGAHGRGCRAGRCGGRTTRAGQEPAPAAVGTVVGGMSAATGRSVCLARIRPEGVGTPRPVPDEISLSVARGADSA